jgi:hypothetical protein
VRSALAQRQFEPTAPILAKVEKTQTSILLFSKKLAGSVARLRGRTQVASAQQYCCDGSCAIRIIEEIRSGLSLAGL